MPYIQKASPWENGYVESFNGKLWDELLNQELLLSVPEARYALDEWQRIIADPTSAWAGNP